MTSDDPSGPALDAIVKAMDDAAKAVVEQAKQEIRTLSAEELVAAWYFPWDENSDVARNVYEFCNALSAYKRACCEWEAHHNGGPGIAGVVRDKYLLPRIREFMTELSERDL